MSQQSDEFEIRALSRALARGGVKVRREKLSRGASFRVKSGRCQVFGDGYLFLDRSLPRKQQISVLLDFIASGSVVLEEEDLAVVSPSTRRLIQKAA